MTLVAVHPASALTASQRLFDALALAFPVRFEPWREGAAYDAYVLAGADDVPPGPAPALILAAPSAAASVEPIRLHRGKAVDRRLHDLVLAGAIAGPPVSDEATVLASAPAGVVWSRSGAIDRVRTPLPVLGEADVLRDLIYTEHGVGLIALVELLRRLTAEGTPAPPPLRATMLFDDPNLRWSSYGHISYGELARHADEHGYHASMAMIPLDHWARSRSAVKLFRERADRLSLAIHGNDHRKRELFDQHDADAALALGAQALRRVARFEASSGLSVGRVMVPPHGMCSQTMARALGRLPFDALCSIHPYPWTGQPPADRLLAGWEPATFAEGCAVIPRLEFRHPETTIALRAYMGHPIVLYGHHDDIAEGLDVLATAAARVNRVGQVAWVSPGEIARSNFGVRRNGESVVVRPFAHRVRVTEPAAELTVIAPDTGAMGFRLGKSRDVHPFGVSVPVGEGPYEIRLVSSDPADPADVMPPRKSVWPHLRRFATESRDRLAPIRQRG